MSSQQFPRHGLPASGGGAPQIPAAGNLVSINQQSNAAGNWSSQQWLTSCFISAKGDAYLIKHVFLAGPDADSSRDADRQQDHPPAGGGGALAFRDEKQETMVVRPYPQVHTHGQPQAAPQTVSIQPGTPVTVPGPPVHLPLGQPAVLTEGQMKVMFTSVTVQSCSIHVNRKVCTILIGRWKYKK